MMQGKVNYTDMVMKRFCDYDYDNNMIVMFDDDESLANNCDDLNICWISNGEPESEQAKGNHGKGSSVPLIEYLEKVKRMNSVDSQQSTNSKCNTALAACHSPISYGSPAYRGHYYPQQAAPPPPPPHGVLLPPPATTAATNAHYKYATTTKNYR